MGIFRGILTQRLSRSDWRRVRHAADLKTGREVLRVPERGVGLNITSVEFTSDGRHLVIGGWEATARLLEIATQASPTWRQVQLFKGHGDRVHSVALAPNGHEILTGSYDRTARIWSIDTGHERGRLFGFIDGSWTASSPDGRTSGPASIDETKKPSTFVASIDRPDPRCPIVASRQDFVPVRGKCD